MISGATGAMAVVMVSLVIEHGEAAFTDLAFAVFVGVIVSALVFAWQHAKHINIDISEDTNGWVIPPKNISLKWAIILWLSG